MTRTERRQQRYQRIVLETNNPTLARQYRDASPARIKAEIGVDVTREPVRETPRIITNEEWADLATEKDYPADIMAYAIQKNREVGADDYSKYGFIYAYKRLVEGKGVRTIDREVIYDQLAGIHIYQDVEILPNT